MNFNGFNDLTDGQKVRCGDDVMTFRRYDYFGTGKIPCLMDDRSIYPCTEFDPNDWELEEN